MRVEYTDICETTPIIYDQKINVLRIDPKVLSGERKDTVYKPDGEVLQEGYDLNYYMTVFLMLMSKEYVPELQGLRIGYYDGVASNLVGNFTKETEEELIAGIDIFEEQRKGVTDLEAKLGPDIACELCETNSLQEFYALAKKYGLENLEHFLSLYNYLALKSAGLTERQMNSVTEEVEKGTASFTTPQVVIDKFK